MTILRSALTSPLLRCGDFAIAGDGGNDEGLYQQYVDSTLNATWGGCITDDSGANVTVRWHPGNMVDCSNDIYPPNPCVCIRLIQ